MTDKTAKEILARLESLEKRINQIQSSSSTVQGMGRPFGSFHGTYHEGGNMRNVVLLAFEQI